MKVLTLYFSIVFILFFSSCAKKITVNQQQSVDYYRNGKVNYISSNKGLLTLSSENVGENINKAAHFAEINALENILFKGIQGSSQEDPIISDEISAFRENNLALKSLIFENEYKLYLTESLVLETYKGNPMTVVQKVTFDIPALRKYLEKNNIIRKFGL
ncbi:MAG: hypothetical protein V4683_15325 [Bacteroidota bacterium]